MSTTDNNQVFGERLHNLRKGRSLTQSELGKILNIKNTSISMYERNAVMPTSETLLKIAQFFNVSVDYLIGNSEQVNGPEKRSVDEVIKDVEVLFYNSGHDLTDEKKKMLSRIIKATIEDE